MTHLTHSTKSISEHDIERNWHLIDVSGKVLGRISTEIASLLSGKNKVTFVRNLDSGDHVVVINAKQVKLTGRKSEQKVYKRYSGFPGGLKNIAFEEMMLKRPDEIVRHSVYGMLPKNKLRNRMITRLSIYKDDKHPYENKMKNARPEPAEGKNEK